MRWLLAPASALALVASAAASTDVGDCLRSRSSELAGLADCGHQELISWCIGRLPGTPTAEDLRPCFADAGCAPDDAADEADLALLLCDESYVPERPVDESGELRRRQGKNGKNGNNNNNNSNNDNSNQGSSSSPSGSADPNAQQSSAAPSTTTTTTTENKKKTTTSPTPTTTTKPPHLPSITTSTTPTTTATSSQPTAEFASFSPITTSTTLTCSTLTTVSTTFCTTASDGPSSGHTSCFPTTTAFPTCAAGLLCRTASDGTPSCMVLDNNLGAAGVSISLFFGIVVAAAVALLTFFCCRDRAVQKRLRAQAEAAALAADARVLAAANSKKFRRPVVSVRSVSGTGVGAGTPGAYGDDRQPLMYGGVMGGTTLMPDGIGYEHAPPPPPLPLQYQPGTSSPLSHQQPNPFVDDPNQLPLQHPQQYSDSPAQPMAPTPMR